MDGIDQDDQLRECCAGFSSKAQFKKCYKGGHLGFCGYSLLNSHIDCNMSCEQMVVRGVLMWEPLNKWQFSTILDEELMNFTAVVDSYNMIYLHFAMPSNFEK